MKAMTAWMGVVLTLAIGVGCQTDSAAHGDAITTSTLVTTLPAMHRAALSRPKHVRFEVQTSGRVLARLSQADVRGHGRTASIELGRTADAATRLKDERSGAAISFALVGAAHSPMREERGLATYENALGEGAHLVHRPDVTGTEDFVSFKSAPAEERLTYAVDVREIGALRLDANVLTMDARDGTPLFRVNAPYLIDAHGERHDAKLAVTDCALSGSEKVLPGKEVCHVEVSWSGAAYPILVDPEWALVSSMNTARRRHTATRLDDGRILVIGGENAASTLATTEIYDPDTDTWWLGRSMLESRAGHTATKNADGDIVVIGGQWEGGVRSTIEVYNLSTDEWTRYEGPEGLDPLSLSDAARYNHSAVLLNDGSVFVAGGRNTVEALDTTFRFGASATGRTADMSSRRNLFTLSLLNDGTVLAAGGTTDTGTTATATTETYDPATDTWTPRGDMAVARYLHTATRLVSGQVLVVGGKKTEAGVWANCDRYDPAEGNWFAAASLPSSREIHTAELLSDGNVLIIGGVTYTGTYNSTSLTYLYDATFGTWTLGPPLVTARHYHTTTLTEDDKIVVIGGYDNGEYYASVEYSRGSLGEVCEDGTECASGHCVGGICCSRSCEGECDVCTIAGGSLAEGVCTVLTPSLCSRLDRDAGVLLPPDAGPDAAIVDAGTTPIDATIDANIDASTDAGVPQADGSTDADVIPTDGSTDADVIPADADVATDASDDAAAPPEDAATARDSGTTLDLTRVGISGGGGACAVTEGPGANDGDGKALGVLLLAAFALLWRRRARMVAASTVLAALTVAGGASAQDALTLDQYRAAVTPLDGFAISRPDDLGHLRFAAQLHLDYAWNPLVYERFSGDSSTEIASVVEHHLVGNLGLALGLWERAIVYAQLPVSLAMEGDQVVGVPWADRTRVGDPIVGARVRIVGERGDLFALAAQGALSFPLARATDENAYYAGDSGVVGFLSLLGELRFAHDDTFKSGRFRLTMNLGTRLRGVRTIKNVSVGSELTYGIGFTAGIVKQLDLHAEAYGALAFEDAGSRETTPFEILAGVRAHPGAGFSVGAAIGTGPVRGYGSPDFRGVLTLGWVPECEAPAAAPEPAPAPNVPSDTDNDGIVDAEDGCTTEAEDRDDFQDGDGCPDSDNDQDGILDANDGAPNDAEDRDGFQDEDGVPDPDNDGDGILDANDGAPNDAEDRDGFQDEDGVPDLDNDGDGVPDADDQCPLAPGAADANGCPRSIRLEGSSIVILQRLEFATSRDVILDRSFPTLEEIRSVLDVNPQLRRVSIEGHTDDRGNDAANMTLSERRAQSVMRWLIEHGIAAGRLEAHGFGETRPIADNLTNPGRQLNRRVEFRIVDAGAAPQAATPSATP